MKVLVEQFEEQGEFENDRAAHALKVHLTAVDRNERQGADEKVVKHMESFKLLLDHRKENELIFKTAYHILKDHADYMIRGWQ